MNVQKYRTAQIFSKIIIYKITIFRNAITKEDIQLDSVYIKTLQNGYHLERLILGCNTYNKSTASLLSKKYVTNKV